MKWLQPVWRYLGWDEETKRLREEARENLEKTESQLTQLRARLQETSRISTSGRKALNRTLSESDYGRQRVAGG